MPFKALDAATKQKIISFNYSSKLELIAKHQNIVCIYCGAAMHCRERVGYLLHFVHNAPPQKCPSAGESWVHLECKKIIYDLLTKRLSELSKELRNNYRVDIECPVKAIGRIIDVALLYRDVPVEAHEAQISPITVKELESRNQDYQSLGIAPYWYFGRKSLNPEIKKWCERTAGEVRFFEIE
ncbi:competence protein CoiA family protein [Myxosarcina sp. GI1]|uniref:competence protein CoiA family protein n=1 Tax=Myxosarcina sp. GI1 TaxID=1541065 RepID=UPI00068E6A1F|nr:competence protein CoiA family protein [Myxosarcina sp. GI1]